MRTRPARLGFFVIAGALALDLVRALYTSWIIKQLEAHGDIGDLTKRLEIADDLWFLLWLVAALAAFFSSGSAKGARRAIVGLGAAFFAEIAVHAGQLGWIKTTSSSDVESFRLVYKLSWSATQICSFAGTLCAAIAFSQIGKATSHPRAKAIALGTTVPLMVSTVPSMIVTLTLDEAFSPAIRTALTWYGHAATLAYIGGFVWAGREIAKVPVEEPSADGAPSVRLGPEWGAVVGGIYTYLLAGLVRVLIGIFTFATVQGAAKSADSYSETHALHDQIMLLGYVGGAAALVMIGSVATFARLSEKVRGPAVGVMVCMLVGLALDAASTSMTASAMTSVSAAFDAMDYLPMLAAVGSGVGTTGAFFLFRTLAAASDELALADNAHRARVASSIVIIAGLVGALAQLAIKGLPPGLAIVLAVLVVPALIYGVIQLVRVMLIVATAIQEKAGR